MRRLQLVGLATMLVSCSDGGVQATFFPAGVSEGDDGTGSSTDTSTTGGTAAASEATMIDPTEGLTTGPPGSSGPVTMSGTDASASTTAASSGSGDPTAGSSESGGTIADGEECTDQEIALIDLDNGYRMQNGLPAVPINEDLCAVAHIHAVDLDEQGPHEVAGCGLRSWSAVGQWSACCYTEDLAEVQCMWDKPRELTRYAGDGVEAVAMANDPATALAAMQAESYGNAMILSIGIWESTPWRSIGAAIHGGHALVWFGPDPP